MQRCLRDVSEDAQEAFWGLDKLYSQGWAASSMNWTEVCFDIWAENGLFNSAPRRMDHPFKVLEEVSILEISFRLNFQYRLLAYINSPCLSRLPWRRAKSISRNHPAQPVRCDYPCCFHVSKKKCAKSHGSKLSLVCLHIFIRSWKHGALSGLFCVLSILWLSLSFLRCAMKILVVVASL